jgi:hypothetical protein
MAATSRDRSHTASALMRVRVATEVDLRPWSWPRTAAHLRDYARCRSECRGCQIGSRGSG